MIPNSRSAARAIHALQFFTGLACSRGHIANRRTSRGDCVTCAKENIEAHKKTPKHKLTMAEYYLLNKSSYQAAAQKYQSKARHERPWLKILQGARRRAEIRDIPFNLSAEWASAIWTGKCAITGMAFVVNESGKSGPMPFSATVDRIIPALGYVPENCRFVLSCVNNFRGTLGDDEMRRVAHAIIAPI